MSKTPIMILQELGVKECVIPKYEIIYSQNGTHENIFTFRVKYNNVCADGTASNKKEAKQNAAQNMLKLLQETSISSRGLKMLESTNSHMTTEKLSLSSSIPVPLNITNYIGILQEYCLQNKFVQPEYRICETEGPAHNVKFKMVCTLGSITEEAVANTKKQAKQLAAQKVLKHLPNVKNVTDSSQCQVNANSSSQTETIETAFKDLGIRMADLKIIDAKPIKDIKLKYLNVTSKENFLSLSNLDEKISVIDYHLYFKSMIFKSICDSNERELDVLYNTFKTYVKEHRTLEGNYSNDLSVYRQTLKCIKEKCNLSVKKISLISKTNMTIIGFRINLTIPFVQFGVSIDPIYAEQEALNKTIEAIIHYLK